MSTFSVLEFQLLVFHILSLFLVWLVVLDLRRSPSLAEHDTYLEL